MLGIVTAQLFSLQHSQHPDPVFGYHALGRPLAALFQSAAIVVILVGGHRFWRQQMNMARGRVWAGGWEIWSIMAFMLLVSHFLVLFQDVLPVLLRFTWTDISFTHAASRLCVRTLDRLRCVGVTAIPSLYGVADVWNVSNATRIRTAIPMRKRNYVFGRSSSVVIGLVGGSPLS